MVLYLCVRFSLLLKHRQSYTSQNASLQVLDVTVIYQLYCCVRCEIKFCKAIFTLQDILFYNIIDFCKKTSHLTMSFQMFKNSNTQY